jgi:hypothetical protein
MTLTQLQKKYRDIAASLGRESTMPTAPQHDGSPHAEHKNGTYFFVVTERGAEYERRQTTDPDELLSWFVGGLTGELAREWELKNRVRSQDSRRLWFKKHVELLRAINDAWAEAQEREYRDVLTSHPFDDAASDRVDYFVQLKAKGINEEAAWQQALDKFPE